MSLFTFFFFFVALINYIFPTTKLNTNSIVHTYYDIIVKRYTMSI